jgi:hypothetical protein
MPSRAQEAGAAVTPSQQTPQVQAPRPQPPSTPPFRSEVRLQGVLFTNFFQAQNGAPSKDVTAMLAGYRGIFRPHGTTTDIYGDVSFMRFLNIDRQNPISLRLGARYDGPVHGYNVFVDRGSHRPSFEVAGRTALATVTTLDATYTYKIGTKWQLAAEGLRENQRFDVESNQRNDYTRESLAMRYRGFGWKFTPYVGYAVGKRDVVDRSQSYSENYPFLGFTASPDVNTYIEASIRPANRRYDPAFATVGAFTRSERRPQFSGFGAYRITPKVSATLYYSHDVSRSAVAYRNFRQDLLLVGVTTRFH